jgi:hypothetical protein
MNDCPNCERRKGILGSVTATLTMGNGTHVTRLGFLEEDLAEKLLQLP